MGAKGTVKKTRGPSGSQSIVVPQEERSFERIFEFFKDRLISGDLRPHDRILSERELATRLQVSRGSLREAMRAMAMLGIIEIRPGQGTFVRSPDVRVLNDFFGVMLAMREHLYDDVLEARIAIECQAIRLACDNATEADLRHIESALGRVLQTVQNAEAGAEADYAFHSAIVSASQNEVLRFIYDAITTLLKRSHLERRTAVIDKPGFLETLGDAHRQVYEAILLRDADQAMALLRAHFTIAQDYASSHETGDGDEGKTSWSRASGARTR